MASYDPQAPYAIRQFELDVLIPIEVFGLDHSFTTSTQAMVTTLLVVVGFLAYRIRMRAVVPGRMQAAAEAIYRFVANTVIKTAGPTAKPAIPFVFRCSYSYSSAALLVSRLSYSRSPANWSLRLPRHWSSLPMSTF